MQNRIVELYRHLLCIQLHNGNCFSFSSLLFVPNLSINVNSWEDQPVISRITLSMEWQPFNSAQLFVCAVYLQVSFWNLITPKPNNKPLAPNRWQITKNEMNNYLTRIFEMMDYDENFFQLPFYHHGSAFRLLFSLHSISISNDSYFWPKSCLFKEKQS